MGTYYTDGSGVFHSSDDGTEIGQVAVTKYDALKTTSETIATEAISGMKSFLSDLQSSIATQDFSTDVGTGSWPLTPPSSVEAASAPSAPELAFSTTDAPEKPTLGMVTLANLEIDEFTVTPPDVVIPDTPETSDPTEPGEAPTITDPDIPDSPSVTLPEVPEFEAIVLPEAPELSTVAFEGERPEMEITAPGNLFVYSESPYVSEVKDALHAALLTAIREGGTGLGAEAEGAIWARARDRLREDLQNLLDEINAQFAAQNCHGLGGAQLAAQTRVRQEYTRKLADLDKDILVQQSELAWKQTHQAIADALQLETLEVDLFNRVCDRAYQVQKTLAEMTLAEFKARLDGYTLWLERYKTDAAVFEAKIRANLSLLEIYKARLEGAKIQSELQRDQVELYKAQLVGVQTQIEIYKGQLEGAKILSEVQVAKLNAFKAKVDAFVAEIQANVAKYQMYATRISGEKAKVDIYRARTDAWTSYVQGKKAQADIIATQANVSISNNKLLLDEYTADVGAWRTRMEVAVQQVKTLVDRFIGEVQAYGHSVKAVGEYNDVNARAYASQSLAYSQRAGALIENAKNQLQAFLKEMELSVAAAEAGAKSYAQVAAQALSQQNANIRLGYDENVASDERTALNISYSVE